MKRCLTLIAVLLFAAYYTAAANAIALHGQSDYISIASPASTASTTTVSVCAWVRFAGGTSGGYIVGNNDGNEIRITNDKIDFFIYSGSQIISVTSPLTYTDSNWHFVCGVRNGTSVKLYVDGAEVASGTFTANSAYPYQITAIGRRGNDSNYFKGAVRGVSLWNKALSAGEVTSLYNGGTFTSLSAQANLVAAYNCTEGTGTTVADASSNGRNGAIQNPNGVYSSWLDGERSGAATWYVKPTGTVAGTGASFASAWNLAYALSHPPAVLPGDTIKIEDNSEFDTSAKLASYLTGRSGALINVESESPRGTFPSKWKIDGAAITSSGTTLTIYGKYATYWDMEVYNSNPAKISTQPVSAPSDIVTLSGVDVKGADIALNYLHVHDTSGNGISVFDPAGTVTVNNLLTYNNGWTAPDRGHGHGIYTHNNISGNSVYWNNTISFNNYYYNLQQYTSTYEYDSYNQRFSGFHTANAEGVGIVGSSPKRNFLLEKVNAYKSGVTLGYGDEDNYDLAGDDLYIYGGLTPRAWRNLTITDSVVIKQEANAPAGMGQIRKVNGVMGTHTIDRNTYYGNGVYQPSAFITYEQNGSGVAYYNFAGWQALGFDTNSTFLPTTAKPTTNVIRYYPDSVTSGRGVIVAWNWQGSSTVSLDLTQVGIVAGQNYTIYNAMKPTVAFASGTFNGTSASVSTTTNGVATRTNDAASTPADTMPEYAMFIVIPGSVPTTAPGTPSTPTATPVSNSQINISWTHSGEVSTSVILEYAAVTSQTPPWTSVTLAAGATTYSHTGLTYGTRYRYRVRAVNASGSSAYSAVTERKLTGIYHFGNVRPNTDN